MPPLTFTFNRGLCFSTLPTEVLLCSSRDESASCYLMSQKKNGEFVFSEPYRLRQGFNAYYSVLGQHCWRFDENTNLKIPLSAGHNEGVIGSLEYEIFNDGLSTINHPYMTKYYITAGYGQRSDVLDSVKG